MDSENQKNSEVDLSPAGLSQIEYLRGLAEIVRDEKLSELEVETGGLRITLKAPELPTAVTTFEAAPGVLPAASAYPATAAAAPASTPGAGAAPVQDDSLIEIVSPMIGVFYRAPSPADPNFVEIGDKIEVGQTVALVEAMKVFNEITSEVAGTVVEIKAQSADLVETGQVLITIRP